MNAKALAGLAFASLFATSQSQTGTGTAYYTGAQVLFTWTIESKGPGEPIPIASCDNVCEGKKHAKHDACDLSCDKTCKARRNSQFHFYNDLIGQSRTEDLGEGTQPPRRSHLLTMGQDYATFGMPNLAHPRYAVYAFAKAATGEPERQSSEAIECWNTAPCSSSTAFMNSVRTVVRIDYELADREGVQITARGPKRTLRFAFTTVPLKLADRQITKSDPAVSCKCEVVQKEPSETGFIPGFLGQEEFAFIEEDGTRRPVTGRELSSVVSDISVQNMNRVIFTIGPAEPKKFFVPAGWELECTAGDGQDVQLQEDLWITVMPWPQRVQAFLAPVTIRTLCLEIDKPEPTPAMTYRFMPPSRPSLMRLARGVRGSSFRGPWDQMRLWIATDYATYAKIREVLLPAPSRRTYLYEMFVAARALAFDPADKRAEPMMETALLAEPKNDVAAASWLLQVNLMRNGKKTADALKSDAAKFHTFFTDPQAVEYMAKIAAAAANIDSEQAATAAVRLLTDCVPAANRADVAAHEEAAAVGYLLTNTSDPKVANVILDYLEANKPPFMAVSCLNVSDSLPQAVKDRAAKLAGS